MSRSYVGTTNDSLNPDFTKKNRDSSPQIAAIFNRSLHWPNQERDFGSRFQEIGYKELVAFLTIGSPPRVVYRVNGVFEKN